MGTKQSAASDPRDATLLTVVSHDRESGKRHIMVLPLEKGPTTIGEKA